MRDDRFDTDSVTVCLVTTDPTDAPLFRLLIDVNETNGLAQASRLMVDKLTTVRRTSSATALESYRRRCPRLSRAIFVFLGIAAAPR